MDSFLDEVADTAEQVAVEQRQVAREAHSMQRLRDRGASWVEILERQPGPPRVLGWLRSSGRKIAAATARLSRGLAQGLTAEGESQRAIARRLGVTHQRVSTMLNRHSQPRPPG